MQNFAIKSATRAFMMLLVSLSFGAQALAASTTYEPQSVFLSPEKEAPMPFTGLAINWEQEAPAGTTAELFVRTYTVNGWGLWNDMHPDIDGDFDANKPEAFLSTNEATKFQYKVILESSNPELTPVIRNLKFTYIHADGTTTSNEREGAIGGPTIGVPRAAEASASGSSTADASTLSASIQTEESSFLASTSTQPALRVISRGEWGADESLRVYSGDNPEPELVKLGDDFYEKYADELKLSKTVAYNDNGELLTWPLEYPEKVTKIFIHHTATTKNLDNPMQAIRDIYYWHAISRGWGDIGYNYIIDQRGNIYEGRYGGDGIVGAHAGPGNVGSIGIAVLGNYSDTDVPTPVIESISALIKAKSAKYGIDTMGSSMFRGEMRPNVLGHRDIMSTSCPGDKLYAMLPTIKALSKNAFTVQTIDKRAEKGGTDYSLVEDPGMFIMEGGENATLTFEVKNSGNTTWNENTFFAILATKATDMYIASDKATWKSEIVGHPVAPGETATFEIPLKASHLGGFATLEVFPMINGTTKLEKYLSFPTQINGANFDYELVNMDIPKETLKPGETMTIKIQLKNTGDSSWRNTGDNKIMLGSENSRDHIVRILPEPSNRLAGLEQAEVKPGETGDFIVNVVAPAREGLYREYFAPVIEGITWLPHRDNYIEFYVDNISSQARFLGGKYMTETLEPRQSKVIQLQFENTGENNWEKSGDTPFNVDITKNAALYATASDLVEESVAPGETATMNLTIQAPSTEGVYRTIVTPKAGAQSLTLRPVPLYIIVSRAGTQSEPTPPADIPEDTLNPPPVEDSELVSGGTPIASEDNIRIGIGFHGEPIISANGSFVLKDGSQVLGTYEANHKIGVNYENGTYYTAGQDANFTLNNPPRFEPVSGAIMRIDNYENRPSWKPELNDNTYRGVLEVNWYDNELVVVNELPLEDYLKGLAEIDPKQHFEKVKTIITLARSYAKYYMTQDEKFPGAPFHLSDDPQRSQYYLGYGFEVRNPTGARAVDETKDMVVTYNGTVIKTPYFSASDGRTRSAYEVWGWTNAPYLISVDDPGCAGEELRGHGVGLSGCGSLYFAEQGKTVEEIIKYYYQGVEVEKR